MLLLLSAIDTSVINVDKLAQRSTQPTSFIACHDKRLIRITSYAYIHRLIYVVSLTANAAADSIMA
jgi:hypothetical protein